jgi:hypothetical protein
VAERVGQRQLRNTSVPVAGSLPIAAIELARISSWSAKRRYSDAGELSVPFEQEMDLDARLRDVNADRLEEIYLPAQRLRSGPFNNSFSNGFQNGPGFRRMIASADGDRLPTRDRPGGRHPER